MSPAQFCRPWGSTQTLPPKHNEAQRFCQDGDAVIQAWGIAHIPKVDPRERRIRLPSEKGLQPNAALHNNTTIKEDSCKECVDKGALPQALERNRKKATITTNEFAAKGNSIKVECRAVSLHQLEKNEDVMPRKERSIIIITTIIAADNGYNNQFPLRNASQKSSIAYKVYWITDATVGWVSSRHGAIWCRRVAGGRMLKR